MATHVLSAIHAKRPEIAAQVRDIEKKLAKLRAALANLDAAHSLLTPDHPDAIPARRGYRRTRYFDRNELPHFAMDALRKATGPLTTADMATMALRAKGLPQSAHEAVVGQIVFFLRTLR